MLLIANSNDNQSLTLEANKLANEAYVQIRGIATTTTSQEQKRFTDALLKTLKIASPGVL